MNAFEANLYDLKIERGALLRNANAYARALNEIEQYRDACRERLEARHHGQDLHGRQYRDRAARQAAAHQRALAKLNADFPMGYCRTELMAVNAAITKAIAALHRFRANNLKQGEHFDSRRINTGG